MSKTTAASPSRETQILATATLILWSACSAPAATLPQGASAARSFRPLSALFFLPTYEPPVVLGAALVPDSKIRWDLEVTAQNLGLAGLRIRVHQQRVRIAGVVADEKSRETMLQAAQRTPGVRSVSHTIQVQP